MTTTPSPEESARRILAVFKEAAVRPGTIMTQGVFIAPFSEPPWNASDFEQGLKYAIEREWIEPARSHGVRLTPAGFAET